MTLASESSSRKLREASADDWVRGLFNRIDGKDTDGWLEYLSDEAQFVFGNAPSLAGKDAIRNGVNAFLSTLSQIKHEIVETWTQSDAVICRGQVTYTRLDGSTLSIPFANVLKLDGDGLINVYLIYADTSRL